MGGGLGAKSASLPPRLGCLLSLGAKFSKMFFPISSGSKLQKPSHPCNAFFVFSSFCRYVLRTYYVLDTGKSQEIQRWPPKLLLGPAAAVERCGVSFPCSLPFLLLLLLKAVGQETLSESGALVQSSLLSGRNSNSCHSRGFSRMVRCTKKRDRQEGQACSSAFFGLGSAPCVRTEIFNISTTSQFAHVVQNRKDLPNVRKKHLSGLDMLTGLLGIQPAS